MNYISMLFSEIDHWSNNMLTILEKIAICSIFFKATAATQKTAGATILKQCTVS